MTSKAYGFGLRGVIASAVSIISVLAILVFLVPGSVFAAGPIHVDASAAPGGTGSAGAPFQTIQAAVNAANPGDTIEVAAGTYTENVNVTKSVTISGDTGAKLVVTTATVNGIDINANDVTVEGLDIEGPANQSYKTFAWGGDITRGIAVHNGVTNFTITDNTIANTRNNILVDGRNTGSITNNVIDNSKSGISIQYTDAGVGNTEGYSVTISGNHQGPYGNDWGLNAHLNGDINTVPAFTNSQKIAANAPAGVQAALLANSAANDNWTVQDQGYSTSNRTDVTVSTTGSAGAQGDPLGPISTIQGGVDAVVAGGGVVNVLAGSYAGPVTITKDHLSLLGTSGVMVNETSNDSFGYGATVDNASNVTISNIAFNAASLPAGYAFHAYRADGLALNSVSFTGPGSTGTHIGGVDINTSSNVTLNSVSSTGFYKNGISVTSKYLASDPASSNITFNNVSSTNNGWSGISFYTIGNDHSPTSIGGAGNISGVSFTGSNTIGSNTGIGLHIQGDSDANEAAAATPAYTVTTDGTTLDLSHVAFVPNGLYDIANYQTAPVNAMDTTFDGMTGTQMSDSQRNFENAKISDQLDHSAYGLVKFYEADTTVDTPTILIPATDGMITSNAGLPKIDWTDVTDPSSPVTYNYQVATSPDVNGDGSFTSPIYIQNGLTASEIANGGTGDGTYYFQVQAVDAAGNKSAWTPTMHVTFDSTAPAAPVLTAPADGTTLPTNEFDFTWNAPTDANPLSYVFHSSLNPAQTDGVLTDGLWTSGILNTPMIHSSGAPDGTWYWQVQATDAAGNKSPWSSIWSVILSHPVSPSTAEVHIYKYLDGVQATTESANGVAFPMLATYNTTTYGAGTDVPYTLGPGGWTGGDIDYEASTGAYNIHASYSTSENTTTGLVGTSCTDGVQYKLDGYSVGATLADAQGAAVSMDVPSFSDLTQDEYVIVHNESCSGETNPAAAVTTNAATGVNASDAILNGHIGADAADGHSFWVSTSQFSTSSPNIPDDVYSTPDFGSIAANSSFNAQLSSLTATNGAVVSGGVAGTMPAITPNTTYYFVAWAHVNGQWIPGDELSFTTSSDGDLGHTPPTAGNTDVNVDENSSDNHITLVASGAGTLTYSIVDGPSHGTLGTVSGSDVTYTPAEGYAGDDSFTFKVNDGVVDSSNEGTVTIHVNHVNTAPTAGDQNLTFIENSADNAITLNGSDVDGDTLTFATTTNPSHGTLSGTGANLTFTPDADFAGTDSFTYTAFDGTATSAPATIAITVNSNGATGIGSGAGAGSGGSSGGSGSGTSRGSGSGTTDTGSTDTGGQVLGAAAFNFTRDLFFGLTGADVTELQTELIAAGYLHITKATGWFGSLTRAAVAKWQADNNITPAAGYFGPISRAKYAADGGFHIMTTPVTTGTTTASTTPSI